MFNPHTFVLYNAFILCTPISVTLDTPMNRKFMSTADFSQWTPLDTVAQ